jgi:hypothetical protein
MPEDAYTALVREIETEKGRMTAHELVCAERYKDMQKEFRGLGAAIRSLTEEVGRVATTINAQPAKLSKWAIRGLVGIMGLMLSLIAWEARQLYAMETHRPVAQSQPWWSMAIPPASN